MTIQKGEPQLSDFDISTIKEEYYYTGEIINPTIVSSKEGMGSAYIVVKDGTTENRPKADSDDPYAIYLHVSKGSNYKAKTIDLNKTITIKRYPITNETVHSQWYKRKTCRWKTVVYFRCKDCTDERLFDFNG